MLHPPARRCRSLRPILEVLEDRCLPSGAQWIPVGPQPVLSVVKSTPAQILAGRVDVAVADPTNPNVVYVGGAAGESPNGGGGIWKTTNFLTTSDRPGPTWVPLIDNMPSLSIFAKSLTISPNHPNILYAAAQGPNGCILKTTDSGAHWTVMAPNVFANSEFGAIVVNPLNPSIVYVAVRGTVGRTAGVGGGVFKSIDGGQNWKNISQGATGLGVVTDLVIDSTGQFLYAGFLATPHGPNEANCGVWRSTDGGFSWFQMTDGINFGTKTIPIHNPTPGVALYIRLAMGRDSNYVYAMMFEPGSSSAAPLLDRFRTTNGNVAGGLPSWAELTAPTVSSDYRFWHMVLAVDPNNPNIIYTNGAEPNLIMSTSGGIPTSQGQYPWSDPLGSGEDVVNVFFDDPPLNNQGTASPYILAGDRAVQYNPSPAPTANTFQGKRGNLGNFLVYNTAVDPLNTRNIFAVSQDQLADLRSGPGLSWNYVPVGNELGRMLVDPANDRIVYSLSQITSDIDKTGHSFIQISTDGGTTWKPIVNNLPVDQFPGSSTTAPQPGATNENAFTFDPNNPNTVLVGAQGVWSWTYRPGVSVGSIKWTEVNNVTVEPGSSPGQVTAVAVAPSNSRILYAATDDGRFWTTVVGRSSWTEVDGNLPLSGAILSINIDPKNPARVYINVVGLGIHRVWVTLNGGATWAPADGNLPAMLEVHSLAADWRFNPPVLYAATDRGVYQSQNGGATWAVYGGGLPNTVVFEVSLLIGSNLLTAATFGRGVWQAPATLPVVPVRLVYYGDRAYNLGNGNFGYLLTFLNAGPTALPGPITLSFPTLPASVPIVGVLGSPVSFTASSITLPNGLAAGQFLTLFVVFRNPRNAFPIGHAQLGIPLLALNDFIF